MATIVKTTPGVKKNIIDTFFDGVRRGISIWLNSMIPSAIMCYTLLEVLNLTGVTNLFATVFAPVMGIFGMPGESMISLVSGFFSKSSGCATAAGLFEKGLLDVRDVTILLVVNVTYGGIMPQWPRTIVVSGTDSKFHLPMILLLPFGGVIALILSSLVF